MCVCVKIHALMELTFYSGEQETKNKIGKLCSILERVECYGGKESEVMRKEEVFWGGGCGRNLQF